MDNFPRGPGSRKHIIGILTALVLTGLATCALLLVLVIGVLSARGAGRSPEPLLVPVTGGETPSAPPAAPTLDSGEYIRRLEETLGVCYTAFNDFFEIEQAALDQPSLFLSEEWRVGAQASVEQFRDDCGRLSGLPDAPASGYEEMDRMLRLSADEAAQVESSFSGVLNAGRDGSISFDSLRETTDHLLLFIDYSNRVDELLKKMKERQVI